MLNAKDKQWLSPFMAVTFATVSISGLLMFFHLKIAGVHPIHQWGGILFLVGGVLHALVNRRILLSYFSNRKAVLGALAGVVIIALCAAIFPHTEHNGQRYRNKSYVGRHNNAYSLPYRR